MLDRAFPGIRTKELPTQTQKYWDKPYQVVEYIKNKHSQKEKERPHGEEVDLKLWDIIKKQTTWLDGKLVIEDYTGEELRKRVRDLWGKLRTHMEEVGKKVISDRKEEIKRKAREEIEKANKEAKAGSEEVQKQQALKIEEMQKQLEELKSGSVSKT